MLIEATDILTLRLVFYSTRLLTFGRLLLTAVRHILTSIVMSRYCACNVFRKLFGEKSES